MKIHTINEVLSKKNDLDGQRIYVEGVLTYETENVCLEHWPKSERGRQSLWLEQSKGPLRFNQIGMEKLAGKKVIALGEFQSKVPTVNDNFYCGFGHLGMWPAQLVVTEIQYYKKWHEANGTNKT